MHVVGKLSDEHRRSYHAVVTQHLNLAVGVRVLDRDRKAASAVAKLGVVGAGFDRDKFRVKDALACHRVAVSIISSVATRMRLMIEVYCALNKRNRVVKAHREKLELVGIEQMEVVGSGVARVAGVPGEPNR
eukprot:SAG11_NODE_662_length_7875_cov_17.557613_5_plen_132_part_00